MNMKKLFSLLLLVCVMATAQVCSADVKYRAKIDYKGGIMTYILAYNNLTATGQYLIKDELDTVVCTFDYDNASHIFTVYREDGSLSARRKFENKVTMHSRDYNEDGSDDEVFTGTYRKEKDGIFWKVGDDRHYCINPPIPEGCLIFLDRGGNI